MVKQIFDCKDKMEIARRVLEDLSDWFGIEQAREEYILNSADQLFFSWKKDDIHVGFFSMKETGKDTVELAVMGVRKEYHRQGVGRKLFTAAIAKAKVEGYSFIQVKTVQMGCYKEYDNTNKFYVGLGFKEFEVFPTLWDAHNPCQIYVMSLN